MDDKTFAYVECPHCGHEERVGAFAHTDRCEQCKKEYFVVLRFGEWEAEKVEENPQRAA